MRTLINIIGYNYSGSTLLAYLLNAHPLIGSTGEINGPPGYGVGKQFPCSCGRLFHECSFFQKLEKRMNRPDFRINADQWAVRVFSVPQRLSERLLYGSLRNSFLEDFRDILRNCLPFARSRFKRKIELIGGFINAACDLLNVNLLVDSSKNPMRLTLLSKIPRLNLKVIHLVRNPAGCVLSALNHSPLSLDSAATAWRRNFVTCRRQLARIPGLSHVRLRYEDLCADPEGFSRELCEFLGVPYDRRMLSFRSGQPHIWGNPMRLRSHEEIRLDERWRTQFSTEQIVRIMDLVGDAALACAYPR